MPCEERVGLLGRLLVDLLERLAHTFVQLAPLGLDEARVRDFLDQPVAEAVFRGGAPALLVDQVETLEFGQRGRELLARDEPLEQLHAECSPDDRRDREHLARRRVETVEPRLQGSLNERGNRELVFVDGQRPLAVIAL